MKTEIRSGGAGVDFWETAHAGQKTDTRKTGIKKINYAQMGLGKSTGGSQLGLYSNLSADEIGRQDDQLSLENAKFGKTVNAVVTAVDESSVTLRCQLPARSVEVTFYRGFLDAELAVYGTPVSLSLKEDGNIRRPSIKKRHVIQDFESPEISEIDKWLNSDD